MSESFDRKKPWSQRAVSGVLLLSLGACAVGPDYRKPAEPKVAAFTRDADQPAGRAISARWWQAYGSPRIDALVSQALAHNPALDAGLASLRAAQENVTAQRGLFYPTVQVGYGLSRQNAGSVLSSPLNNGNALFNLHTAQLSVGYVPDVFGANARQVESLEAQAQSQRYQNVAMRLSLISNVVAAGVQERLLLDQIAVVQESLKVSEEQLGQMRRQLAVGYASGLDVAAQELQEAQTRALLPPLQKQLDQTRDLLAVLCGAFPESDPAASKNVPEIRRPTELPGVVPSSLVEHRPDVQAAQEQLHATHAQIGVAVANMLPQLSLSAALSASNNVFAGLFSAANRAWSLLVGVTQPIFNGGTLSARKRAAEAQAQAAQAQYQTVVLTAFQNVADTLYALKADQRSEEAALKVEEADARLLEHLQRQLNSGYVSRLLMLNAQQALLQAKLSRLSSTATVIGDTVSLYMALGGGWSVAEQGSKM